MMRICSKSTNLAPFSDGSGEARNDKWLIGQQVYARAVG